jgi:2-polyprenyl-3-methyl-5-hydroxy-6-metoxy-1,4-benzoquinol methylase
MMMNGKAFLDALDIKAKRYADSARQSYESHEEICGWLFDPLARWAQAAYGDSVFEQAARGYAQYCMHVSQAKQKYEQTGRYTPENLPAIIENVYEDSSYMTPYMWAAILIYGFWPSMTNHIRMFREDFLNRLPTNPRILELACGHGVMGLLAVNHRGDAHLYGYDIGAPAIEIAHKLASASQLTERAHFEVKDVLSLNGNGNETGFQGVMAAMLAEHLEDPPLLFDSISRYLVPGGLAFFSTALESPQCDHIYEFHHESEPILMAEKAGLRVIRLVCDRGAIVPGQKFTARALAMVLERV